MKRLIINVQTTAKDNIIYVQWNSDPSPCKQSDIDYVVTYTLISQCSQVVGSQSQLTTSSKSAILSNLEYHSNYTIQVTARRNDIEIPSTAAATNATTQQGGKNITIRLVLNTTLIKRTSTFYFKMYDFTGVLYIKRKRSIIIQNRATISDFNFLCKKQSYF